MVHSLRDRVGGLSRRYWRSQTAVMLALAVLVGIGSGYGAVGFRWLVDGVHVFFQDTLEQWLRLLGISRRLGWGIAVLTPALGGLLVGLLTSQLAPEARGPGVAPVMEALALRAGRIRPILIVAKPVATSLTLGSGGSGGREGPIVQMGSAIGSLLSQIAELSDEQRKNLVACGAAGGIAATFNAPLAGVMFALEVLLAEFGLAQFTNVVVAAVIASVIGHAHFGDAPAFPFPPSAPPHTWELPLHAALGVLGALVGVSFTRALYSVDDLFERQPMPAYLKPALGGLVVGIFGFWFPRVLGVGYEAIEAVLFNEIALSAIVVLGLLKIIVTAFTIGSGGSGGIFGPCLFIGAMTGGFVGQLAHRASGGVAMPSAYALVGMSAVFAAASHAPITAILTLFEMTRDYNVILPLMLGSVISAILARHLLRDSIYTVKLSRRGIEVYAGRNLDLMDTVLVGEAMTPIEDMVTIGPSTPLTELTRLFDESHHHGVVVVDENDHLQGIATLSSLENTNAEQLVTGTVADILTKRMPVVFPDQTLKAALQQVGASDPGRIPVVERPDGSRLVGVLRRGDIVTAYAHAAVDDQARRRASRPGGLEQPITNDHVSATGTPIVEVKLREDDRAVGKTVQELDLPLDSLIVSIRRDSRVLIPRGGTRLEPGDIIVALAREGKEKALRRRIAGR